MVDWSGTVVLTTPRLLRRTFRRDDLPSCAALNADPEVTRHLGGPLIREDSDDIAAWAPGVLRAGGAGAAGGGAPRGRRVPGDVRPAPPGVVSRRRRGGVAAGPGALRRLGMAFDHEAEIEDMGMVFQVVVYAITNQQWLT